MKVLLTIDVEAHRITAEISAGLELLLAELKKNQITATFFLDIAETKTWGTDFLRDTAQKIKTAGHDLQLHIHPHHISGDDRWLLSDYSDAEQTTLISSMVKTFTEVVGHKPSSFRAGGFGLNTHTLDVLAKNGIKLDSSYVWKRPGCNIQPAHIAAPSRLGALLEIPLNPIVTLGFKSWPLRVSSLDFNWLPLSILKGSLRTLRKKEAPVAVVLLHSSSLLTRTGAVSFDPSKCLEKKWRDLLAFIKKEEFETVTTSDLAKAPPPLTGPDVVLTVMNPLQQYRILLFQAFVGRAFSFKFRYFLIINALVLLIALIMAGRWLF